MPQTIEADTTTRTQVRLRTEHNELFACSRGKLESFLLENVSLSRLALTRFSHFYQRHPLEWNVEQFFINTSLSAAHGAGLVVLYH